MLYARADGQINQIVKVLNAHLTSLQWVDSNSVLLNSKIQEVSKQFQVLQKEQERFGERRPGTTPISDFTVLGY